jgi:hypothetical protein
MAEEQIVQSNKEETSDKTLDFVRLGIAIGIASQFAVFFTKFNFLPISVEYGIGWFSGMLICYLFPKKIRPDTKFSRWMITSLLNGIIVFIIRAVVPF